MKSAYEVRYEGGHSHVVFQASSFAEASEIAHSGMMSCLPPEMRDPDKLVRQTIVRCLELNPCVICGRSLKQPLIITPHVGGSVMVCFECALVVAKATLGTVAKEIADGRLIT